MKTIYLAGGCFWGVEKYFSLAKGVIATEVGYANGTKDNPRYEDLKYGLDDAAEAVKIDYDEKVITLEKLLELYLRVVDPYSLNQQGGIKVFNIVLVFILLLSKKKECITNYLNSHVIGKFQSK